jgi:transposase-like protein
MAQRNNLTNPIFQDAEKAREWLEARLWKDGPICPHCGVVGEATRLKGKSHRPGLYQCNACREPFTVTVGTLYERSKVPLNKWLAATHLLMASKKGMSALQIGRLLGLSKKTAWFVCHRIRESLREGGFALGVDGKIVEADETYHGKTEERRASKRRGTRAYKNKKVQGDKRAIISIVERKGHVRSFHVPKADAETAARIVRENIAREARLFTDDSKLYKKVGKDFAEHSSVKHTKGEYVRGEVHTNTIEGYFSIFKRGMRGNYQFCAEKHLHRYLAEFDFRYNRREALNFDDVARFDASIPGIVGKRLTYKALKAG